MIQTDARAARRTRSPHTLALISGLALVLVMAGCSVGGDAKGPGTQAGAPVGEPPGIDVGRDDVGGETGVVDEFSGEGARGPLTDVSDRSIIKTGELTIQVPDVAATVGRVRALALELGGYVAGSFSASFDESASLTLRVPVARFDDALARLNEFDGKVLAEASREEDVTTTVIDLQARIDNLEASEDQYRTLLARAEEVEDILAIQTRLDQVRGEIESMKAQLKHLSGLAEMATLTVTVVPEAVRQVTGDWDPEATIDAAVAALVSAGQGVVNGAIWFAIVWLPVLVALAIGLLLLRGIVRRVGRRLPPRGQPPAA
jgi:hypothetical protein